jgi:hypothetical protein
MLNNITNFFNLISTKKVKTQLDPTDLLAIGTKDPRFSGNYQPTLIKYSDLASQILTGPITVGVTSIASGTVGRLLFEGAGNVVQESANLFWNNISNTLTLPELTATERVNLEALSTATTQSTAVIRNTTTNSGISIVPNGTGAITASIPDGTVTGGNARGQYAVDLQTARGFSYEVASGDYSFAVGFGNIASGAFSIAMGLRNTASGQNSTAIGGGAGAGQGVNATNSFATAIGGLQNLASGQYSGVFGGLVNTASSNYSTISGGQSNTASTNTHATVVGGQSNTSSGQHSISGGLSANASGNKSIALGQQALASGSNSVALGGDAGGGSGSTASGTRSFAVTYGATASNQGAIAIGNEAFASAIFSMALGNKPSSRYYGKLAYANGNGGQYAIGVAKRTSIVLNSLALGELFMDNSSTKYQFLNGGDVTMSFTIDWVAKVTAVGSGALSVGDAICGKDFFLLKSISQNNTIGTITRISTSSDTSMSTSTMTYSVNSGFVTGFLTLNFNAPSTANGTTFQIVANIQTVEIGTN